MILIDNFIFLAVIIFNYLFVSLRSCNCREAFTYVNDLNRSFSRGLHRCPKSKTKDPPKFLSSSGIRGGIFISVNNFTAQ